MAPQTRRELLLALLGAPAVMGLSAQTLVVRLEGDFVRISAPRLQFLTGKILDRLHDGASVALLGQLSLSLDENVTVQARAVAKFALSYDIWEELFSVTLLKQIRESVSNLSLAVAQNWVLDQLALRTGVVPPAAPFWLRLDLRVEDPRDGLEIVGGSGINLTKLVEIFSRPPGASQPRWSVDAGPLRLAELRTRSKAG